MARRAQSSRSTGVKLQARHFWFIATVVRDLPLHDDARRVVASRFADTCAANYSGAYAFKRDVFLAACGVPLTEIGEGIVQRVLSETKARRRKSRVDASLARVILAGFGGPSRDFHTLNSSDVEQLAANAKLHGYHKPRNASGSLARYWHAYLVRIVARD